MPTLPLPHGGTLAYEDLGQGQPVVCIQGVGVVGNGWRPQLAGLSDEFRLIAHDNRGIGASSPIEGRVSVEAYAADVRGLLDGLGIERAHVMGHSLGGVIALQLALDAPQRVRSLALLCTFYRGKDGGRVTLRNVWTGVRTLVGTRRMRRRAFLSNVLPPTDLQRADLDALHDRLSPLFGRDLAELPPIVMRQVRALGAHDVSGRLRELAGIPTLVLAAHHDVIAPPSQGRALAAAIAGARYREVHDAAHGLPITHADQVNSWLREHLRAASA